MNWSFQLFSARNTPIERALEIVADAGYSGVETFRDNFEDEPAFRQALDKQALSVRSMHVNIGLLREQATQWMQRANHYGCKHIVCPYLDVDQRPTDTAAWRVLAQEMDDHAKRWTDAGFEFAWHNHDFEFLALPDGAIPMQLLLEGAAEMSWEIDAAWIVRGAADPALWIKNHASRISAVHLKDIAPAGECLDEDGWADLGYGVVPWPSLIPELAKTPAIIFAMEHDKPSDLQRFATRSMATAAKYSAQLGS